jgi:hypothetical protein
VTLVGQPGRAVDLSGVAPTARSNALWRVSGACRAIAPPSVGQAATALIAIINSRPQCPRGEEFEAILKKMTWVGGDGPDLLEVRAVLARLAESREAAGKLHRLGTGV